MDIIFISYNESLAEENWRELKTRFPRAKRVHGVEGIVQAHKRAAEVSSTEHFFVVDGDNKIEPHFNFEVQNFKFDPETLYVWRCLNPANDLVYGFGAIKLYSQSLLKRKEESSCVDLATHITQKYQIVHEVASQTWFFNTPEEAWRGAFRECAKLSSQIIARQNDAETKKRLMQWCEQINPIINAEWILLGAQQGQEFGINNSGRLFLLNDFSWLKEKFQESQKITSIANSVF